MTIDKSTRILVDRYIDTYVVCGGANYNPAINITREDYEAFQVAIDTMQKYQRIQGIIKAHKNGATGLACMNEICEVLEDGSN